MQHTAEIVSAVCYDAHWGDHFVIEYLGENETEIENTLGCLSGAQMGMNHEKNKGQKSRDKLPLKNHENGQRYSP